MRDLFANIRSWLFIALIGSAIAIFTVSAPVHAGGEGGERNTKPKTSQTKTTSKTRTAKPANQNKSTALREHDKLKQVVANLNQQIKAAEYALKSQNWRTEQYLKDIRDTKENIRNFTMVRQWRLDELKALSATDEKTRWSRETLRRKDELVGQANALQSDINDYKKQIDKANKKLDKVDRERQQSRSALKRAKAELRTAKAALKKAESALR